jgi:hypothetical protein
MTPISQGLTVSLISLTFAISLGSDLKAACVCLRIGGGICVPDFSCSSENVARAIEKGVYDTGQVIKKAGSDPSAAHDGAEEVGKIVAKTVQDAGVAISKLRILETGYSQLQDLGKEEAGYGLYSYAVFTSSSLRSETFLREIFKAIPPVEDTSAKRAQLNIFYIPIKRDKGDAFAELVKASDQDKMKLGAEFSGTLYDYQMARAILNHVCNPPADSMKEMCVGPMSDGPYIFTYASPASGLEPVPPPFLFVDLSNVREEAFAEFISAFRAQVKQEDVAAGDKIHSLRLRILNITLTAASLVDPVRKAVADIIHDAGIAHDTGGSGSQK